MKTIVLGPPGTGKTHTLLNEVDKYLKTTDPNRIGYFSFTQKAAYEARDRMLDEMIDIMADIKSGRTAGETLRSMGISALETPDFLP